MAKNMLRAARRTGLVLLVGGIVVAATYLVTPPYDPKRAEAYEEPANTHAPVPGSEAALRRMIGDMQRGQPDYALMSKKLADVARPQRAQSERQLARLGPLKTLTYVGGAIGNDRYRATFQNGSQDWGITLGKDGVINGLFYRIHPVTAQDWIDLYSDTPPGDGAERIEMGPVRITNQLVVELGTPLFLFLVLAAFGRYVLRVRL